MMTQDTKEDTELLKSINEKLEKLLIYVEFFTERFANKKTLASLMVEYQLRKKNNV